MRRRRRSGRGSGRITASQALGHRRGRRNLRGRLFSTEPWRTGVRSRLHLPVPVLSIGRRRRRRLSMDMCTSMGWWTIPRRRHCRSNPSFHWKRHRQRRPLHRSSWLPRARRRRRHRRRPPHHVYRRNVSPRGYTRHSLSTRQRDQPWSVSKHRSLQKAHDMSCRDRPPAAHLHSTILAYPPTPFLYQ